MAILYTLYSMFSVAWIKNISAFLEAILAVKQQPGDFMSDLALAPRSNMLARKLISPNSLQRPLCNTGHERTVDEKKTRLRAGRSSPVGEWPVVTLVIGGREKGSRKLQSRLP